MEFVELLTPVSYIPYIIWYPEEELPILITLLEQVEDPESRHIPATIFALRIDKVFRFVI